MIELTREKYKKIKGMNRHEMEVFLSNFHDNAYQSGVKAVSNKIAQKLIKRVEAAIKSTPGIGQKRFDDIMANITKEVTKEVEESQEQLNEKQEEVQ